MKNLYLVTSAIMTAVGTPAERLLQTLHTFDSIHAKDPNAEIWLCESSIYPITDQMLKFMGNIRYINFSKDQKIHQIKKDSKSIPIPATDDVRHYYEHTYVKNLTETYMIIKTLNEIDPTLYGRIFKISGRYFLTHSFNIDDRMIPGKINIRVAKESPFIKHGVNYTGSNTHRPIVTWDYCPSIHTEIIETYKKMETYLEKTWASRHITDLEHACSIYFDSSITNDMEHMSVMGRINGGDQLYYG